LKTYFQRRRALETNVLDRFADRVFSEATADWRRTQERFGSAGDELSTLVGAPRETPR
jgi:hypothetical protein